MSSQWSLGVPVTNISSPPLDWKTEVVTSKYHPEAPTTVAETKALDSDIVERPYRFKLYGMAAIRVRPV